MKKSTKSNSINICWSMEGDEYIEEFYDLQKTYPNYKLIKNDGTNINEKIYEESIVITSGSIFKKNIEKIERILFSCKYYIFDFKSRFHKNLSSDYNYIKTVTNDLKEIKTNIDKDALELSKIFIII